MKKKNIKLSLDKESIISIDNLSASQIVAGNDKIKDAVTLVLSAAVGGISCVVGGVILYSRDHCPTAQTDCDSCTCYTRWCNS